MKIAIQGLGRMGIQIAHKLADDGHTVIAHNRHPEPIDEAVTYGAIAAYTKDDVLREFGDDQIVLWIMLPAEIVDAQVDEWLSLIPKGSIIIDGGNSDFRLTKKLNEKITAAGSALIDVDTSAFAKVEPALKTLSLPEGAYYHFGPSGSGHFVKMTHNAIEYGMMESLAEGYRVLKEGPYKDLDLAAAGDVWQHHSVVTSWLNELSQSALAENPNLDGIEGFVAESGEARWTLEAAKEIGFSLPSIQAAFDVRVASQKGEVTFATKLLAAMRNKFGGHELNK
jgi:6-phosphogluconate dehydrogenase